MGLVQSNLGPVWGWSSPIWVQNGPGPVQSRWCTHHDDGVGEGGVVDGLGGHQTGHDDRLTPRLPPADPLPAETPPTG